MLYTRWRPTGFVSDLLDFLASHLKVDAEELAKDYALLWKGTMPPTELFEMERTLGEVIGNEGDCSGDGGDRSGNGGDRSGGGGDRSGDAGDRSDDCGDRS
eukprot:1151008-Pleurochrysis_carterae.AAC.1